MKNPPLTTAVVTIRALRVTDNRNGTFGIVLPSRNLSGEQTEMLGDLFPNLLEKAHDLLNLEVLLSALATDAETFAPDTSIPENVPLGPAFKKDKY